MSGFLGRLIAKASQQAPVLVRRQPSLFEPMVAQGPVESPVVAVKTDAQRNVPPGIPPVVPGRVAAPPFEQDNAVDVVPAAPAPIVDVRPPLPRPTRQEAETVRTRREVIEFTLTAKSAAKPDQRDADALPVQRQAQPLEASLSVGAPPGRRLERMPVDREVPRPAQGPVPAADLGQSPMPRRGPQPSEVSASILVPPSRSAARAVQMAKSAPPRPARLASPAGEPNAPPVQITIGRVEVRAVQGAESATARSSRPQAPKLTLDDYLRQRNGDRR